ncbi:MAG: hypothetical protein KME57_21025 [Scytonema hyalinum WJT4-NPBG1]|nr:hypothetical protein [Scytonema hyalinum WJT4-NPBG1]
MTEISAYIDKDVKRRFKLACTAIDKTMSEVMVDLVETWLEQQEQNKKDTKEH